MIKEVPLVDTGKKRNEKYQWYKYVSKNLYKRHKFKMHSLLNHGTTDFFNAVEIETTTFCNRRCPYCPNALFDRGLKENEKRMPEELFQSIINQLSDLRYIGRVSLHFYGEPTSDERLPDFVAYARKKLPKSEILIASNGDYLSPEYFEKLRKAGISRINLTTHWPNKTMTPKIKALRTYLRENPQSEVQVIYNELTPEDDLENRGGIFKTKKFVPRKSCHAPAETMNIDYQGNWVLCCNDYHSSIKWGNLEKEKIMDIWTKPRFARLRKREKEGKFDLKICQGCTNKVQLDL